MRKVIADHAPPASEGYRRRVLAIGFRVDVIKLSAGWSMSQDGDLEDILDAPPPKARRNHDEVFWGRSAGKPVHDAKLNLALEELAAKLGSQVIPQAPAGDLTRWAVVDSTDHDLRPGLAWKLEPRLRHA